MHGSCWCLPSKGIVLHDNAFPYTPANLGFVNVSYFGKMVVEQLYIVPVCIYLILSGNFVFLTL